MTVLKLSPLDRANSAFSLRQYSFAFECVPAPRQIPINFEGLFQEHTLQGEDKSRSARRLAVILSVFSMSHSPILKIRI